MHAVAEGKFGVAQAFEQILRERGNAKERGLENVGPLVGGIAGIDRRCWSGGHVDLGPAEPEEATGAEDWPAATDLGAPVKPAGAPTPSISSQRGHGKRSRAVQSAVNDESGHFVHDVLEIKFGDALALHIGSGIQEIDGVGHAVLDGEFDGVHFVAEGFIDGLGILDDASAELGGEVIVIDEIFSFFGIVVNGGDIGFSEGEAADVFIEVDELLESHAVRRSLVVRGEEFGFVMNFIDVLPAAAGEGFENGGAADEVEQAIPIDRVGEIVERFGVDVDVAGITLLREQNGFGNGDAEFGGDGVVEEFVVSGPPERIVDDVGALEDGVFQVAAVVFDFVGDAVDDDAVAGRFAHARAAELGEFRRDAILLAEFVDAHDEGRGKAVFTPAEKADLFHDCLSRQVKQNPMLCRSS